MSFVPRRGALPDSPQSPQSDPAIARNTVEPSPDVQHSCATALKAATTENALRSRGTSRSEIDEIDQIDEISTFTGLGAIAKFAKFTTSLLAAPPAGARRGHWCLSSVRSGQQRLARRARRCGGVEQFSLQQFFVTAPSRTSMIWTRGIGMVWENLGASGFKGFG